MNPAASFRRPTKDIVNALKSIIEQLDMPADFNPQPGDKAFGNVQIFDTANFLAACKDLLTVEQRVCLIVPMTETFEKDGNSKNMKLVVKRKLPISLLISDSVIGNRVAAFLGDDTTPGAQGLAELVLPAITGQLLDNPGGVICEPDNISVMTVSNTETPDQNRVAVVLQMMCSGGRIEAATNPVT